MQYETVYVITDCKSGLPVKHFKDRRRAYDYADRRDNEYGAVRFIVTPVHTSFAGAAQ